MWAYFIYRFLKKNLFFTVFLIMFLNISFADAADVGSQRKVLAVFPEETSQWVFRPGIGNGPSPHETMGIVYDPLTSQWHAMGRQWGDEVNQLLYTSPNGMDGWQAAPNNPVIDYDHSIPKKDADWYVQMPNYGKYPDGSMRKLDGEWVVVVVNFDGSDSDLHWLTSADGFNWNQRGDTGIDIGPAGSGDRGEQWPTSLIYNPEDHKWYLFYHGGGSHSTGSGRTIGVAIGDSPKDMTPWNGSFEHQGLITQNALILKDASGWLMVFQHGFKQGDGIWFARSNDLLNWTPQGQIVSDGNISLRAVTVIDNGDETVTWRIYSSLNGVGGLLEAVTAGSLVGSGDLTPPEAPTGVNVE